MANHTFDLAAALADKAVEQLAERTYGITRVLFHEFGSFPLCYNHTRHDTGHGVKMWAYDDTGLLAAAEASAPHVAEHPRPASSTSAQDTSPSASWTRVTPPRPSSSPEAPTAATR